MTCTYGLRSNVVFSGLEDGEIGCIDYDLYIWLKK